MIKLNLRKILKGWRKRIHKGGISEATIANEAGVAKGSLSEYINEKSAPTIDKFQDIENALRRRGL